LIFEKVMIANGFKIVLVSFFLVVTAPSLWSSNRSVVLDFVKVNGELLAKEDLEFIVISHTDSISFFYHLETKDTILRTPFIFRISIKNSRDSSSYTRNVKNVNFKNLPEDDYTFRIEAFDPRNKWKAEPLTMSFKVDNRIASLLTELRTLRNKVLKSSVVQEINPKQYSSKTLDFLSVAIGFAIGLVVLFVYSIVSRKLNSRKALQQEIEPGIYGNVVAIDKDKYELIVLQNSNLRAEVSALRGQIDALNSRTDELRKQNQELKDKLERLSRSKDELEELQQQKDELFALVIHDIKNPASLIKSLVELLRSYDLTATEQQEIINDIFETTSRIVLLSQEVSRVLALESSVMSLNLETGSLNELVQDVVESNLPAAKNKNIEVAVDFDSNISEFKFDINKVREVIDNLLSNAIKFTQRGGEVRVSTRLEHDKVVVQVADNGLGLSEEDINRAFQRGARLSATPTGNEPSSGLGLWIVKRLVEAMKGRVWVISALGKGSTFSFTIPVVLDRDAFLNPVPSEELMA
jgi:signal transduction histidine kinase